MIAITKSRKSATTKSLKGIPLASEHDSYLAFRICLVRGVALSREVIMRPWVKATAKLHVFILAFLLTNADFEISNLVGRKNVDLRSVLNQRSFSHRISDFFYSVELTAEQLDVFEAPGSLLFRDENSPENRGLAAVRDTQAFSLAPKTVNLDYTDPSFHNCTQESAVAGQTRRISGRWKLERHLSNLQMKR